MSRRARRPKQRDANAAPAVDRGPRWPGRRALPVAALLFASGAAALVYETLWVKQLGRVVGVEVHAVSIALSAFFAGLALGGALLGRLADRVARPVRLYAALEAGVAVLGVLSTLALARSAAPFVELQDAVGPLAWALPFALVGLPAFLMGGTLPALLRSLHPDADAVAPATGLLYAANTAGAVLGTLATPFLLVPAFGIQGTGFFAAALGLAVACAGARPRSPCCGRARRDAPAGRGPGAGRPPRRTLRPCPLRGGRRRRPRLRGRLVRGARAVPEHPQLRVRGDAGHLPVGPRARQLPVRPLRRARPRSLEVLRRARWPAPARAPWRSSRCWARGCPTPRPSRGCGRCARPGARPSRSAARFAVAAAGRAARAHDVPRRGVPGRRPADRARAPGRGDVGDDRGFNTAGGSRARSSRASSSSRGWGSSARSAAGRGGRCCSARSRC